jgi:non-ribosomal peptide synthetase component F
MGKELPPLKLRYKDFSEWQNDLFAGGEIKKQEQYWLGQFERDIPRLNLPLDYARPEVSDFESDVVGFYIPPGLTAKVRALNVETETTPYMVLLAVYNILLARYCSQEDIIVGTATAGRRHTDLENIVGLFVNMLTMRNRPMENLSFMEFLNQVKGTTLEAYENQDYQFDELVERLGIEPQVGRNPLFDAQFTFQNAADAVRNQETIEVADFRVTLVSPPVKRQPFDLGVNVTESENTYSVKFGYLTALFKHSTIEDMAAHYEEILHQCMENESIKIKDIVISLDLVTSKVEITREDVTDFEF